MPKRVFLGGPIHRAVIAWMKANNIDINLVRNYTLEYRANGEMWITPTMYVNDNEAE